jgi:hypothetical protein
MCIVAIIDDLGKHSLLEYQAKSDELSLPTVDSTLMRHLFSHIIPVSSSTGAGVQYLWEEFLRISSESSIPPGKRHFEDDISSQKADTENFTNLHAIREHKLAKILRAKQNSKFT